MMKGNGLREINKISFAFKSFISYFKTEIIYSSISIIFGIIMGATIISINSGNIELENIFDKNILMLLTENRGFFTIFIWYALYLSISLLIIYLLCRKRWCIIFPIIVLIINGFAIGYHIAIMIVLFGLFGFLNTIIIIVPFDLISCICLVFISAVAIKKCITTHKYGCNYLKQNCTVNYISALKFIILVSFINIFIKSLLMPIIRITIIIS